MRRTIFDMRDVPMPKMSDNDYPVRTDMTRIEARETTRRNEVLFGGDGADRSVKHVSAKQRGCHY